MSAKKETPKFETILVPRMSKNQADLFVGVAGERFLIKRGVPVSVPDYVADVVNQSIAQDQRTMDWIAEHSSN